MATFEARKQTVLDNIAGGCDNSAIGSIDAKVVKLCNLINQHQDYVTTSSCSGRISIYWEGIEDKKRSGKWLLVSHDQLPPSSLKDTMEAVPGGEGLTFFKFEGFVIHIEARTLDAARDLLTVALACGYKNSGLVVGKRFMVGIRGTLKIDAPIAEDGKWLVSDGYLELLGRLANDKFTENERRVEKFETLVQEMFAEKKDAKEESRKKGNKREKGEGSVQEAGEQRHQQAGQRHVPTGVDDDMLDFVPLS